MTMMIKPVRRGLLLAGLFAGAAAADTGHKTALSRSLVEDHVRYLASDELGGRGVGTPGIDKAAQYIAARFKEYGLAPAGDEGSYLQWFDVTTGSKMGPDAALVIHGSEPPAAAGSDFVTLATSSAERFEGPVVFAGFGVSDPDHKYDDYAGLEVAGKILLVLTGEPKATNEADGTRSRHARLSTKAALAKDRGAAALLLVDPPAEEEDRLSNRRRGRGGNYGIPMLQVSRSFAERILAAGAAPGLKALHQALVDTGAPASRPLSSVRLAGTPGLERTSTRACNVIGVLPGEGPLAGEFVVFGGHFDHLGTVPPTRRPDVSGDFDPATAEIHNGADDNASGTAGVMELARIYAAGAKQARSLVFMAFSGEELGLLGSRHFVEHPTVALDKIVAMFNMDMIGRLEGKPLQVLGARTAQEFEALVTRAGRELNLELALTDYGPGNSDHSSFYEKRIPVLFAFTGVHSDYHRPSDDTEKVDLDGQIRVLELLRGVADQIIATPQRPTYQQIPSRAAADADAPKVRLGIMPSYTEDGQRGWGVSGVVPGGAAEKAGLRTGDRILSIDGKAVTDIYSYMEVVKAYKAGDAVQVAVLRGQEELTLKVTLEPR